MTLERTLIAAAAIALAGLAGGWQLHSWKTNSQLQAKDTAIAQLKERHAAQLGNLATAARDVADKVANAIQLNQAAIAAVDTKITGEAYAEKQELDRLRACVSNKSCGVRLITQRPVCSTAASDSGRGINAAPGSLGDAAVQLDAETGLRVLDLRASVRDDERKLQYLQAYARQCEGLAAQNEQLNLHPR